MRIPEQTIAELESAAPFPVASCPSLLHLLSWVVRERPDFPMMLWPDEDANYSTLSARDYWIKSDQVYQYLKNGPCSDIPPQSRLMLLHDNYKEALILLWAFWKADYKVMLVANRIPVSRLDSLRQEGGIEFVLTTKKLAVQLGHIEHRIIPDRVPVGDGASLTPLPCRPPRADEIQESAICLHTSGSTSAHKPVWLSNYYSLQVVLGLPADNYARLDHPRHVIAFAPLYHALGFFSHVALATSGAVTVVFPPGDTFPPKPSVSLRALAATNVEFLSAAPTLLESLMTTAQEEPTSRSRDVLRAIPVIAYGGSHMPRCMLRKLRDFGLNIVSGYGATEVGLVMDSANLAEDVQAMMVNPSRQKHFLFEPFEEDGGVYRLILKKEYMGTSNLQPNDPLGYDTGDLFAKGPVEGTWTFLSRCDDIVVQVNGEKTNALSLEMAVTGAEPSLIAKCLVFGQQKPTVGILVQLNNEVATKLSPAEVLQRVRAAVRHANLEAPTHSRILEKMIGILPPDKTIPITPKLSLRRRQAYEDFDDLIEEMYSNLEAGDAPARGFHRSETKEIVTAALKEVTGQSQVQSDVSFFEQGLSSQQILALISAIKSRLNTKLKPETLYELSTVDALASFLQRESAEACEPISLEETADLMASLLSEILSVPKESMLTALYDKNLFDIGLTSQLAIQLRAKMLNIFKKSLPSDLLYEHPTLKDLADWLSQQVPKVISKSVDPTNTQGVLDVLKRCLERLDQMELGLPDIDTEDEPMTERTYLLTGSTGALGGQILAKLATVSTTKKIYCLVRDGGRPKLIDALNGHRIDTAFVTKEDSIVECLPFLAKDKHLGIEPQMYRKIRREVTDVVHSAWKMDFNQRVQDFAPDCLESLLNLIHFCAVSDRMVVSEDGKKIIGYKKRIYFISSVSSIAGYAAVVSGTASPKKVAAVKNGESIMPGNTEATKASPRGDKCIDIPEEYMGMQQLRMAVPMGYGQSKFIAEAICDRARHQLKLSAFVIRCGQLSGDSCTGAWNTKELVSLLSVAGACDLGVLPDIDLSSEFVPMDVAGAAVVDVMKSSSMASRMMYHIANPHGGTWRGWATALREAGIKFQLVSSSEFGKQLGLHKDNRCQVLASFLEKILREPNTSVVTRMGTDRTCEVSEHLRKCPPVDGKLAGVYLDYWRSVGFLKTQ